jgi:hypothetical protein
VRGAAGSLEHGRRINSSKSFEYKQFESDATNRHSAGLWVACVIGGSAAADNSNTHSAPFQVAVIPNVEVRCAATLGRR